jgi:hypothetical protein
MSSHVPARPIRWALAASVIAAVVVGGCSGGASAPTANPGGNGGGGQPSTANTGGSTVADACKLLTAAEVQSTIGFAVTKTNSYQDTPGQPGCTWSWASSSGGDSTDNVSIVVIGPGGKADFDSARSLIEGVNNGLASAAPSLAASAGALIQANDVPGVGDSAFMGDAFVLYVLKGDTEFKLQPAFLDPDVQGKLVKLAKIVQGRL